MQTIERETRVHFASVEPLMVGDDGHARQGKGERAAAWDQPVESDRFIADVLSAVR